MENGNFFSSFVVIFFLRFESLIFLSIHSDDMISQLIRVNMQYDRYKYQQYKRNSTDSVLLVWCTVYYLYGAQCITCMVYSVLLVWCTVYYLYGE